ncbi:MAG: iron-sulfur cluster assembly accessory protein [Myxococcaceae bacterium]|nr:iron-sulfur cluster assembly accessory protein [Myxococcaceae bacterium]MCI0669284.1 iron-sulfur cluster assembly accessory protein [Myxococcaceae bacterium]
MSDAATHANTPPAASAPVAKPARGISIGDSAVARLKALLTERGTPEAGLRVAVKGGGCSGLQYVMEWTEQPRERDKVFERDGVRMFVDPKSYLYLIGTELVYEETLMASGFRLDNPNVKAACGCGESFTV